MIEDKKICICIPAGRKRYLEILINYLLRDCDIIDEIRIWINTTDKDDLEYIESLPNKNSVFKLDYSAINDINIGKSTAISLFFKNCCDENTVYLRFDDDIVFIEKDFIKEISEFRIKNPSYFLILGNVINNSVCDYIHKNVGALQTDFVFNCNATCNIGWANEQLALQKHNSFFENFSNNSIEKYKFENTQWDSRFSINAISWLGCEFKKFGGMVEYGNEEVWLTESRNNIIFGKKVCCHYSFFITRDFLSKTDILQKYKDISY